MLSYEFDIRHLVGFALALIALHAWKTGRFLYFMGGLKFPVCKVSRNGLIFSLLALSLFFSWDRFVLDQVRETAETFPAWKQACNLLTKNAHVWFFLCAVYVAGAVKKSQSFIDLGLGGILSSGLSSGVGTLLKFGFLRARPYNLSGPRSFFNSEGITEDAHAFQSLPSGDVALIAGFSFYWFFAFRNRFLKAICLFLPVATAYARIADNKHWPSDTFISILLGLWAGLIVRRSLHRSIDPA